jgi:hypothetical protein
MVSTSALGPPSRTSPYLCTGRHHGREITPCTGRIKPHRPRGVGHRDNPVILIVNLVLHNPNPIAGFIVLSSDSPLGSIEWHRCGRVREVGIFSHASITNLTYGVQNWVTVAWRSIGFECHSFDWIGRPSIAVPSPCLS